MKKFSILIVGMLLVSLLGSCKKDNTGNYKVVFKANVQQPNSGSKTSIQPDGSVLWSTDDAIKVYNGDTQSAFALLDGAGTTSASFGGDIAEADTYYGAYPASKATFSNSGDNKMVTFTLPTTQQVGTSANDFDPNVSLMVAASNTQSFSFNNVFGILALKMKSANSITHVTKFELTAKNNVNIWGSSCSVTVNDNNTFAWNGFVEGGKSSITLTCDVTLTGTPQTFYILVPPVEMGSGLELKIYNGNDEIYSLETSNPVTIGSNQGATFQHEGQPLVIEPTEPAPAGNTVDLSTLTANYEAQDGDVLTGSTSLYSVTIADGATVTLDGATISGVNNMSYQWAGINCLGDATIILSGTNTVKGFYEDYPGIHVPQNKTLTIQGSGSLTASSNGWGCGIGGGNVIACGNIVIAGGTITATGGGSAAGIGGGRGGSCGDISITGGTITATGDGSAAGIGSGYWGSCGNITITDGVTSVTATKGNSANYSIGAGNSGSCGTVTIGGTEGAISQSPYTYPTEPAPAHEYVDLGLPSGLLWATCNVGAASPEEYGDYFAWGETTTKDTYNWSTYVHCMGSDNTFTKYCNKSFRGYNGYTDTYTTLLPEDDAATANWGSGWRMPTKAEFEELYNNTTVTWTQQGGVNGLLFTAANSNSLFLPAAGHREYGGLYAPGGTSYYWLSSLNTSGPYQAWNIFSSGSNNMDKTDRYLGYPVRPVREPEN